MEINSNVGFITMIENNTEGTATVAVTEEKAPQAPSQKVEKSEKEKAEFSLKKNADRVRELGGDPADILNIRPTITLDAELDDDTPLTVGKLREVQKQDAHKTALQMAEELPDDERDDVKEILTNNIKPSGDARKDLSIARGSVNALRNARIAEEAARRGVPRRTAAGGSADPLVEEQFVPTEEEARFMRPPYNMSKDKILASRKRQ